MPPPPAPEAAAASVRVTFTPEVMAELREKAGMRNASVSEFVCVAVEHYLDELRGDHANKRKQRLADLAEMAETLSTREPPRGGLGAILEKISFTPPPGYDWKEDRARRLEEKHAGIR